MSVLASLTPLALCQVSHSIDQDEDLLAVDSVDNKVNTLKLHFTETLKKDYSFEFQISFRHPILPPPPSSARLVTKPRASNRVQGAGKGPQQMAAFAGEIQGDFFASPKLSFNSLSAGHKSAVVHNNKMQADGSYAFK